MSDRRTKIDADQILDDSITPNKLATESLPSGHKILTYNPDTSLMKWDINKGADNFEYSGSDIEPISTLIFISDSMGDLMPSVDGLESNFFEIIANEIVPKV